jgi:hypothetical protein
LQTRGARRILYGAFALLLFAGCAARTGYNHPASGISQRFEATDEFKIEGIVYGYLLERDFWKGGDFSAIFLKGSNAEVAAVVRRFPNHVPKIKPSDRVRLHEASSPIDKETGRPAMLLAAISSDPEGDRAEAIGTYYAGPMVSGRYVFTLKKVDGEWTIESVK